MVRFVEKDGFEARFLSGFFWKAAQNILQRKPEFSSVGSFSSQNDIETAQ